jgi:glycosyltransferase involved in cell wall biosynthesis
MANKKISFCIANYNNPEILKETLTNLIECTPNTDEYDILIVDDSNNLKESEFVDFPNTKIYHNEQRKGVGYSLDRAVKLATTESVFFMGDDVRFVPNWFDRFYSVILSHPQSLVSGVCLGLNMDRRVIMGKENRYYGAKILFHVTPLNNNKAALPYREYLEAKWQTRKSDDIYQLPCILGAAYGAKRDWFIKIRGFEGHRCWGDLEPLVSLRSYICGGDCILDPKTTFGHIFKTASSNKPVQDLIYNKILIAKTLLPTDMEKVVIDWVKTLNSGPMALRMIERDSALISLLAGYGRESVKKFGKSNEWDEEQLRTLIKPTGILDP